MRICVNHTLKELIVTGHYKTHKVEISEYDYRRWCIPFIRYVYIVRIITSPILRASAAAAAPY